MAWLSIFYNDIWSSFSVAWVEGKNIYGGGRMSAIHRFPIVTFIMILITFFFIIMYMVTSNIFFYSDNPLKSNFEQMGNESLKNPFYKGGYLNNSNQSKTFFQYGMVTSVCMTFVVGIVEIVSSRRSAGGKE